MNSKVWICICAIISLGLALIGYNEWSRFNLARPTKILATPRPRALSVAPPLPSAPLKTREEILGDADAAADFLERSVQASGRFVYRIDTTGLHAQFQNRLNWVRQLGALYCMALYDDRYPSATMQAALKRGVQYVLRNRLYDVKIQGQPMKAIFKDTRDGGASKPKYLADLSGTALGIVDLMKIGEKVPGLAQTDQLREMGRFLLAMQNPNGSFFTRYDPSKEVRLDHVKSLHAAGESLLALSMLYARTREKAWLKAALNGFRYLADSRIDQSDVPTDNWSLTASEYLLQIQGAVLSSTERAMILAHARQVLVADMRGQTARNGDPGYGSFFVGGKLTPSGNRLEGLLSGLRLLPSTAEHHELRQKMRMTLDRGMIYLHNTQIHSGEYRGAIAHAVGGSDLRIDYTAHALNAMLQYSEFLKQEARLR